MTTVADELALYALLDSLDPMQRASIERACQDRFGPDEDELEEAYERGYHAGVSAGRRQAQDAAAKSAVDTSTLTAKPDEQKPDAPAA